MVMHHEIFLVFLFVPITHTYARGVGSSLVFNILLMIFGVRSLAPSNTAFYRGAFLLFHLSRPFLLPFSTFPLHHLGKRLLSLLRLNSLVKRLTGLLAKRHREPAVFSWPPLGSSRPTGRRKTQARIEQLRGVWFWFWWMGCHVPHFHIALWGRIDPGAGGSACNQSPPAAAAKKGVRAIAGRNRDNWWAEKDSDLP